MADPVTKTAPKKKAPASRTYEVRAGHAIFVGPGEKATAGDLVSLTKDEAKPFLVNENIKVYLGDEAGDDDPGGSD